MYDQMTRGITEIYNQINQVDTVGIHWDEAIVTNGIELVKRAGEKHKS